MDEAITTTGGGQEKADMTDYDPDPGERRPFNLVAWIRDLR